MEDKQERKTQYERGVEHALQLLSMSVDFYPKRPSATTLELLGTSDATADALFGQLQRFRERIAAEVRGGKKEEAA